MQFFLDNIILIAVAFVSGAMLVWPLVRGRASGPTLSTLQATQLINSRNPQVVDLRNADEFAKGSLPNARNIPAGKVTERAGDLKKDKPVLLVCATGTSAGRTAALAAWPGIQRCLCTWRRLGRLARGRTAGPRLKWRKRWSRS